MTTIQLQPQSRLHVLLVDVEHDFFAKVSVLLDEAAPRQFEMRWASTYGFAVTAVRRHHYDLCLASSQVGHRRGSDLVADFKARGCAVPVILLASCEEMFDLPVRHPMDCLDRHRLSPEMLRRAVRDALGRPVGGTPLISPRLTAPPTQVAA